jgi:tetratricopeptide (TPR) repeat protein
LTETPDHVEALNNLASLLAFQDGYHEEALRLINRAIMVAGDVPSFIDTRALVYLQRNQPEQALVDLGQAKAAISESAVFHFHLARAYSMTQNEAEARKTFQHCEQLGLKRESLDPVERGSYDRLRQQLIGH